MPTAPLSVPSPAFYGLAKQKQQSPLGPEWAVKLKNIVVDDAGRLSSRKGWVAVAEDFVEGGDTTFQLHEFVHDDGTTEIIIATEDDIFTDISSPTSIVGMLTPDEGNWKFINFNGFCLGWQDGENPIQYDGVTDFEDIVAGSGSLPTGNTCLAAFGRVWALDDDKQTIKYSALLDHTLWDSADGGGLIDMRNVWTKGMDEVVHILSFGSSLVVFGKRHIVMWVDGAGSAIGLSPENMYVSSVIENVGLVARDAVALVGEVDVVFWSFSGARSLTRTAQEQSTPANELAPDNRDYMASALTTGDLTAVRSVYSDRLGLVLLSHPDYGKVFVFDMKQALPDGGYRLTEWTMSPGVPSAMVSTITGDLYFGFQENPVLGQYSGYDDNGTGYQYEFESGWIQLSGEEGRIQSLKALKAFLFSVGENLVTFKWWVDFKAASKLVQRSVGAGDADEWGVMEWGIGEWGSGEALHKIRIPLAKEAEYFKLAILVNIEGGQFAVQPVSLYSRATRLA